MQLWKTYRLSEIVSNLANILWIVATIRFCSECGGIGIYVLIIFSFEILG